MGILNVTKDSFFDGGRYTELGQALNQAARMLQEGADFIDVGGYSTRPGALDIPEEEELRRVLPVITSLRKEFPEVRISIDTFRSGVARAAVGAGASIINDISGGQADPAMLETAADLSVPYIGMHTRGTPETMNRLNQYEDLVRDLIQYFSRLQLEAATAGINDLVIDPGFGFAKGPAQNFELLSHLERFAALELPILVGLSRKSFIYKTLETDPEHALNGTTAMHSIALLKGAHILRVHDVREAVECIRLMESMSKGSNSSTSS